MSREMRVFFSGPLPSPQAAQKVMCGFGFPYRIVDLMCDFDRVDGFLPMICGADQSGIEICIGSAFDTIEARGIADFEPTLEREAAIRWRGDTMERACAYALSAAIAQLTGGIVYEDESGSRLDVDIAMQKSAQAWMAGWIAQHRQALGSC
ncbi:MAG: hypothetical protein ACREC6_04745 [Hyphomicrobiaceae bacterium]